MSVRCSARKQGVPARPHRFTVVALGAEL